MAGSVLQSSRPTRANQCSTFSARWSMRCAALRTLFVRTLRAISAGEEILIDYAYNSKRQTRWGFGPHMKKTKSESVYTLRQRNPNKVKYGEEQQIE